MDELIERGLKNKRESKYIEFKESIDLNSKRDWCEIVKDIVAIANTGGGVIVFGLNDTGLPSGKDVSKILDLDPAEITDKIYKYTGVHFSEFDLTEGEKSGQPAAVLRIYGVISPIVFEKPGTYPIEGGKQKTAFSQGTVYFRHGAKSETGSTEDIRKLFSKNIENMRKEWVKGVRKIINAPPGHQVAVLPKEVVESNSHDATPIRITDDPNVTAYFQVNKDQTHPHRQKEVIEEVNKKLPDGKKINTHDILAVRRVHGLDNNEYFCYHPKFGSAQYSDAFVDWLLKMHREDKEFFHKARNDFYKMRYDA